MKTAKLSGDAKPRAKRGLTAEPQNKHIRYRQKNRNAGLCAICAKPSAPFYLCAWHRRWKNANRVINNIVKRRSVRFASNGHSGNKIQPLKKTHLPQEKVRLISGSFQTKCRCHKRNCFFPHSPCGIMAQWGRWKTGAFKYKTCDEFEWIAGAGLSKRKRNEKVKADLNAKK